MGRLIWTVPSIVSILVIEAGYFWGLVVPAPYLFIVVSICIAATFGGQIAGLIAGMLSALHLIHAYLAQLGPTTLREDVLSFGIAIIGFVAGGFFLGRLKDQRAAALEALREAERRLEASLWTEMALNLEQAAQIVEREARLDTAVRIADIGHYAFDVKTGHCTFCSEQHAAHLGMTVDEFVQAAAQPEPVLSNVHEADRQTFIDAVRHVDGGEAQTFEYRAVRPTGEVRFIREIEEPVFDDDGEVIASVGTSIDLTELRRAEDRLRQSQRIEAIGTLTGGVAHDFNNLLAVILGNLELSLEHGTNPEQRELIESAIKATQRGADLTQNLLSFARRAHLEPTRFDLNQLIQDTMTWANRVLPETIVVESNLTAERSEVDLDVTSASNALINLLLNARDAMSDMGTITIETTNLEISEADIADFEEDIAPGWYVVLGVRDTGQGIDAELLDRIFEPFYSEKPVGKGSGLGLSMVHGFMTQSRGAVRVYSEVGVGTTFKLFFKAADEIGTGTQRAPAAARPAPTVGGKILLAEDEEDVAIMLDRVLSGAGYSVTVVPSGDAALEVFKARGGFDLVLTDVVMPGDLQGPALCRAIRAIDPDVPCIFLSGHASDVAEQVSGIGPSEVRLQKPVARVELLRAVAQALRTAALAE